MHGVPRNVPAVTAESIDHALRATRVQWLVALNNGDFDRAKQIQQRLDELLDQRCTAHP